jgi:hypothetical protein
MAIDNLDPEDKRFFKRLGAGALIFSGIVWYGCVLEEHLSDRQRPLPPVADRDSSSSVRRPPKGNVRAQPQRFQALQK